MPGSIQGESQGWFTPTEALSTSVTGAVAVDVARISAVMFTDASGDAVDISLIIGGSSVSFPLPAGQALGLDESTQTITTDIDCYMHAMGGR